MRNRQRSRLPHRGEAGGAPQRGVAGAADPTDIFVEGIEVLEVPTLSGWGLLLAGALLALAGSLILRRAR